MSLVCATNFTPRARAAAQVAAELARRQGARLHLLHLMPDDLPAQVGAAVREAFSRSMDEEVSRLAREFSVKVSGSLVSGLLADALPDALAAADAEMLVIGSPRPTSRPMGLGGSIDRIAQVAGMPLLRVAEEGPWHEWLTGRRPLRVMLGVERSEQFEAALGWVRTLAKWGPLQLLAGHVFYVHEAARRLGLPAPLGFDDVPADLEAALTREVLSLVGQVPSGVKVSVCLQVGLGRVSDHLLSLASEQKTDLLVLGTHERRALAKLWSVSHQALRLAPMSVAVVPRASGPLPSEVALPHVCTVLVATDFSDAGNRAIRHAFSVVEPGGTVHLLHVTPANVAEEQMAGTHRLLTQSIPNEATRQGKHALTHVARAADAALAVLEAGERLNADFLCMGSHGRNRASTALLGSVAARVVQRSRRPVLLVPMP